MKGERGEGNTCTERHIPVLFALKHADSIDFTMETKVNMTQNL